MKSKNLSLRNRLFYMLVLFSLASLLIVTLVACRVSFHNTLSLAIETSKQLVEKTTGEVEALLVSMGEIPKAISRDTEVQRVLRTSYSKYTDQFSDRFDLDAMLSEINAYNEDIFAIYFLGENGIAAKSKYFRFKNESIASNPGYLQACRTGRTLWLPPGEGSQFAITTGERLVTAITPVKEISSGRYAGAVVIEVEESKIRNYLVTQIGESGCLYVEDGAGQMIMWPEGMSQEQANALLKEETPSIRTFFSEDLLVKQELPCNNWAVVGSVSAEELTKNAAEIMRAVLLACVAVVCLSAVAAYQLAHKMVEPILRLNDKMQEVEGGNLAVEAAIYKNDEIGQLTGRFNQMIRQIRTLVQKEKEDQQKLRRAELRTLQAQIRPHFLYNTLDSVIWMARAQDYEGIIKMITALTRFLKISLNRGREIIPLREEAEHAASYLIIQNTRYKGQFTYDIQLDESIEEHLIPKLILQPLVENSIYHGMKMKRERCCLSIRIRECADSILISVTDDGIGMEEETLQKLRNTLRENEGPKLDSYGCVNVNQRIKMLFGEEYGLEVDSTYGEGSCFYIRIPKDWKEGPDEGFIG